MKLIVITQEEFDELKKELIDAIKSALSTSVEPTKPKWLRTKDVCKILRLSGSAVQNLRNSGDLKFTKVSGTIYYDSEHLEKLLSKGSKESNNK